MNKICKFQASFDKSDVFSDGNLKARFEVPYNNISEAIQTVMVVDKPFKIHIWKEEVEEPFIVINKNEFWKLQVYHDGNSKFEFKCDPKTFDTNKLNQIIEEVVEVEVLAE